MYKKFGKEAKAEKMSLSAFNRLMTDSDVTDFDKAAMGGGGRIEQLIHSDPPTRLLSNEIQEIISDKQNWMVQNGIVLFLFIMGCLIGATFFISYPDVVPVSAKLTSVNAPKEVKVKTEGKLVKLNTIEGKNVSQK